MKPAAKTSALPTSADLDERERRARSALESAQGACDLAELQGADGAALTKLREQVAKCKAELDGVARARIELGKRQRQDAIARQDAAIAEAKTAAAADARRIEAVVQRIGTDLARVAADFDELGGLADALRDHLFEAITAAGRGSDVSMLQAAQTATASVYSLAPLLTLLDEGIARKPLLFRSVALGGYTRTDMPLAEAAARDREMVDGLLQQITRITPPAPVSHDPHGPPADMRAARFEPAASGQSQET